MSLWKALLDRLEPLRLNLQKRFWPENPTSHVDFSIALIALAAKLAKADGRVDRSEVAMFRQILDVPPSEEARVGRIFNLCRQDMSGFESYAARIGRLVQGHPDADLIRENLMDGLFHIAMADAVYHPAEDQFLLRTADLIGMGAEVFQRMRARHVPEAWDPYEVLGVPPGSPPDQVKTARNELVKAFHPDLMVTKGLPEEMRRLAEIRIREINRAYEEIRGSFEKEMRQDLSP